jgi:hypothetical protein
MLGDIGNNEKNMDSVRKDTQLKLKFCQELRAVLASGAVSLLFLTQSGLPRPLHNST